VLYPSLEQGVPLINICEAPDSAAGEPFESVDASGRVLVQVPAEGDWGIRDAQGRYLGWIDGELVSQIPDAHPIEQVLGSSLLSYRELYLPVAPYTLHGKNNTTPEVDYTFFGDGRMVGAEGNLHSTESPAETIVSADLEQITVTDIQNLNTLTLTFINEKPGASRVAAIVNDLVTGEADLKAQFDGEQFVISRASGSLHYAIKLSTTSHLPGDFISETIELGPEEEHRLTPLNWNDVNFTDVRLEIDQGLDGTIDETRILTNHAQHLFLPSIMRN
jgi:hypothetical protein